MQGTWREGFAGTIQAFVKNGYVENYKYEMDKIFGKRFL